ncbi:biotin transporter BioY [Synechococcus elongatus]|uniref:Biotin transporter n=1 Tax=Synechococcus elongatus (strain ATCC 33912 / PCC 7942 / FACHB-805) TaxID=1140 RepID=Q31MG2_SYNE7|nr:biotin transporter BioY [Synechococcus elongatus]ABB57757.1 BioY protein [Synechococcus elongatus PCC 7942 = FACHB-805]AJD57755.1 BioY protein [Synechococcus elongatus UTEX 2973]MBD2586473.1 biotin transporter BioY [Synechococcus elongatus FACHB-242]MBD2687547.1 biotin transporter BioY [Synechococcus elongatus FACHB-1061]MBD2706744.1 biotin transporter BioY [Synechococcus elongatus PCC 7942 = FACHB-805]
MSLTGLLWAGIGLLLTIAGTFIEPAILVPSWQEGSLRWLTYSLTSSAQVAAMLFTSCMGGAEASFLAQVAYLALGLSRYPVFSQGGGLGYWQEPGFGFLIGFLPAAWLCGRWAFRQPVTLEHLSLGCLLGLATVQFFGAIYLGLLTLGGGLHGGATALPGLLWQYNIWPLSGQLALVCGVTLIAFLLRRLLLY